MASTGAAASPSLSLSPSPSPSPSPASPPGESVEERLCWICYGGEEDAPGATWIAPCRCSGSLKFCHVKCLRLWLATTQHNMASGMGGGRGQGDAAAADAAAADAAAADAATAANAANAATAANAVATADAGANAAARPLQPAEGAAQWRQWQVEHQQGRRDQVRDYAADEEHHRVHPSDIALHHAEVAEQLGDIDREALASGHFTTRYRCPQCMTPYRVLRPRQPLVLTCVELLQSVSAIVLPFVDMAFLSSGVWLAMGTHGMLVHVLAAGTPYKDVLLANSSGALALTLPCMCASSCWLHMLAMTLRNIAVQASLQLSLPAPAAAEGEAAAEGAGAGGEGEAARRGGPAGQPAGAAPPTGFLGFDTGLGRADGANEQEDQDYWNQDPFVAEEELLYYFQIVSMPLAYSLIGRGTLYVARRFVAPLLHAGPVRKTAVLSANVIVCGGTRARAKGGAWGVGVEVVGGAGVCSAGAQSLSSRPSLPSFPLSCGVQRAGGHH